MKKCLMITTDITHMESLSKQDTVLTAEATTEGKKVMPREQTN
jgi:hypothetical protein